MNNLSKRRRLLFGSKFWVVNKDMPGVLINGTFVPDKRCSVTVYGVRCEGNDTTLGSVTRNSCYIQGIDFTNYKTLSIIVTSIRTYSTEDTGGLLTYTGRGSSKEIKEIGTYSLDISNVTGVKEIRLSSPRGESHTMVVSHIWLE